MEGMIPSLNGSKALVISDKQKKLLRAEIMQDIVRDGVNEGSIKLQSEILDAEAADPVLLFTMKMIVEAWLISHGKRMIDDGSVSASIRVQIEQQKKRLKAGLIERVYEAITNRNQLTRTELIEQNEALAGFNESLKTENQQVKIENSQIRMQAAEILNAATAESVKIVKGATATAESILSKTRKESSALVRDAENRAQQIIAEASLTRLKAFEEKLDIEDKIRRLATELEQKQNLLAEIDKNPQVVEAYRNLHAGDSNIQDEMINQAKLIKLELQKYRDDGNTVYGTKLELILKLVRGYRENILSNLCIYEEKFGPAKRLLLMANLLLELKKIESVKNVDLSVGNSWFSITFFYRFLRPLCNGHLKPQELLDEFEEVFGAFLSLGADWQFKAVEGVLQKALKIAKA